jgi:hypothetical protein
LSNLLLNHLNNLSGWDFYGNGSCHFVSFVWGLFVDKSIVAGATDIYCGEQFFIILRITQKGLLDGCPAWLTSNIKTNTERAVLVRHDFLNNARHLAYSGSEW